MAIELTSFLIVDRRLFVVLLSGGHKYFHFFSKMATTQDKITALEEDIKELNAERKAAVGDERRELLAAITAKEVRLGQLEREQQQQQQQQGMSLILFMIFIRHLPPFLTIV